jgi:DNA-binding NarL/FixJ family response regulator
MNRKPGPSVAIVDDEFLLAEALAVQAENLGLTVCGTAATAEAAIALAEACRPELVLMDVRLNGEKDGVDAAVAIHEAIGAKVIFVTGSNEPATIARISKDHPSGVLFKTVTERQLSRAIEAALKL